MSEVSTTAGRGVSGEPGGEDRGNGAFSTTVSEVSAQIWDAGRRKGGPVAGVSALRRGRASLGVPGPRPSQRPVSPLPRRNPQAASAPFPRGSRPQSRARAARHLALLARTPRTVETGGLVHRGPPPPTSPGPGQVLGCGRSRGGTSLGPPFPSQPLPTGSAGPAGPEGARVVPPPWVTFPRAGAPALALPDTGRRDPAPTPGGPGAAAPGRDRGCRELPGGSRGRCLAGRSPGLLPSPRAKSPFGRAS